MKLPIGVLVFSSSLSFSWGLLIPQPISNTNRIRSCKSQRYPSKSTGSQRSLIASCHAHSLFRSDGDCPSAAEAIGASAAALYLKQNGHAPSGCSDGSSTSKRRDFIRAASYLSLLSGLPSKATFAASLSADVSPTSMDCLQDLPPFDASTTVRLYLCRHGETEYNRLRIVQGARVDAPLNDTGRQQATLLGQALSRAVTPPTLFLHSPLRRARETAQLAATATSRPRLRKLDGLAEVDFGAVAEGTPVADNRGKLIALYTAWAMGNLDARMTAGDGESGREILQRIDRAIDDMVYMAAYESNDTGCLAAVAHSSYLRLLLGAVTGFAAFSATSLQANCCVNVLDFARPERRQSNQLWLLPTTTTTTATNAAESSSKMTRTGKVIRVNETRHLASIPTRPSALLLKA